MSLAQVGRAKKLVGWIVGCAALPVVTGGSLAAYVRYRLSWADKSTKTVCDLAVVGAPVTGLEQAAAALGLNVTRLPADSKHDARVVAAGGFMMTRHACEVSYAGNRIVAKHRLFLD